MTKRPLPLPSKEALSWVMSLLGRRGGRARAERLTPERRREIAAMGAAAAAKKARRTGKAKGKVPTR